jgi:hypothetical protein
MNQKYLFLLFFSIIFTYETYALSKEVHGMKKTGCMIIYLCIVCIFAYAEVFTHEEGNLEISLPDNWMVEPDEDMMFASSPDHDISYVMGGNRGRPDRNSTRYSY